MTDLSMEELIKDRFATGREFNFLGVKMKCVFVPAGDFRLCCRYANNNGELKEELFHEDELNAILDRELELQGKQTNV